MATLRALITHWNAGDLPADYCSHTVHHDFQDAIFDPSIDYTNHANEIRDLFFGLDATHHAFGQYVQRHGEVRIYNLADAEPRPVHGHATFTPSSEGGPDTFGPAQVALVLSFYGTRNLKSQRGHIYLGPFIKADSAHSFPDAGIVSSVIDLGHGLFDIGGQDVAHVVYSPTHKSTTVVHNYWADNRWDTQRRRLPKATSRVTLAP